jgi:radical SAM superfamily enzyme YgiQ (UPF0313 family)
MEPNIILAVVVNAIDENTSFLGINEYLGVGYIKEVLKQNGYNADIRIILYNHVLNLDDHFTGNEKLVGFSMYSDTVNEVLDVANRLKKQHSDIHITIGGPQVNGFEQKIIDENASIDSVVSFEGEQTFLDLFKRLEEKISLKGCKGLTYREDGGFIVSNPPRELQCNLDALPYPSRDIHEKYHQQYLYISGSRGCMGGCSFCGETLAKRTKPYVRTRSAKSVVDEMEFLYNKYKISAFRFTDASFEDPGEEGFIRANKIFDEIIKRKLKVSLHLFTRAELVCAEPDEYFTKAHDAGVECFYIGVESGNNDDLRLYNKRGRVDTNNQAMLKIRNAGIHLGIGFICFNPFSTYETLLSNAKFLQKSGFGHVFYLFQTRLEVLPQAAIRKKIIQAGLLSKDSGYRSHFYQYEFENPQVRRFFDIVKKSYTAPPIYYMDTILGMHRTWANRILDGEKHHKLMEFYKEVDNLSMDFTEKNFNYFTELLDMCFNGANDQQIEKTMRSCDLNAIYPVYLEHYNKINIRITKERLKADLLNI